MIDDTMSAGPGERPRILLVDDDPDLIDLYAMQLTSLGYAVSPASSGAQALDLLEMRTSYVLLLTDVGLGGGMDGQAIAEAARRLRPDLPVIFMSGYTPHFHNEGEYLDDSITFLQKPFRKKQLQEALIRVLGQRAR